MGQKPICGKDRPTNEGVTQTHAQTPRRMHTHKHTDNAKTKPPF